MCHTITITFTLPRSPDTAAVPPPLDDGDRGDDGIEGEDEEEEEEEEGGD